MESFFSTVKNGLAARFPSFGGAKMELFDYIEVFYNRAVGTRRSGKSARPPSSDARPRRGWTLPSLRTRGARPQGVGTQVAALFYTLCGTARLVDIDPHAITTPGAVTLPEAPRPTSTG